MGDQIKFSAGENPYAVEYGGFYRRWMPMLTDLDELVSAVSKIKSTTEESWIPIWSEVADVHEKKADQLIKEKKQQKANNDFMLKRVLQDIPFTPVRFSKYCESISRIY